MPCASAPAISAPVLVPANMWKWREQGPKRASRASRQRKVMMPRMPPPSQDRMRRVLDSSLWPALHRYCGRRAPGRVKQALERHGLHEIRIEPGVAHPAGGWSIDPGDGNQAHGRSEAPAEKMGQLPAVDARHVDVDEYHLGMHAFSRIQGIERVDDETCAMAAFLQHPREAFGELERVVDDQDVKRCHHLPG